MQEKDAEVIKNTKSYSKTKKGFLWIKRKA